MNLYSDAPLQSQLLAQSMREKIDNYRRHPGLNQSFLKDVLKNTVETELEINQAITDGTIIDSMMLTPELFQQDYLIMDVEVPSEQIKKTIDAVAPGALFTGMDDNREALLQAFRSISAVKWSDNTVYMKLVSEGQPYWDALISARGKQVISTAQYDNYRAVFNHLLTGPTRPYLLPEPPVSILMQVPIYFDYEVFELDASFQCKALLDIVLLDEKNKEVRCVDVKVTQGSTRYWPSIARKLRYDIQAAWYCEALAKQYPDYKVLNPVYLVESVTSPGKPMAYQFTDLDLKSGKHGVQLHRGFAHFYSKHSDNVMQSIKKEYPGFLEALRIYHHSQKAGLNDYDLDYHNCVNSNAPMELNLFTL